MTFNIRPYHSSDLTALYRICLETGDSGEDATALYHDPDLLGHFYAAPYAVLEPKLSFVLTHLGTPCGYVLGARDSATFGQRCEKEWFPPLRTRYLRPKPDDPSRDAAMIRLIHQGHSQTNDPIEYPAHLHIDILPVGQGQGWGGRMMSTLLAQLQTIGVKAVHLGVARKNIRAIGFYEHVGFHRVDESATGIVFGMHLSQ
ncbi:GNAT family N-acetyltransferase [Chloroflexi bacterium TSY]|nr:GNAT family N-acetyltransferase [Chloroflexi bacterium TSY]